jgi:GxxExxY protein
LRGLTFQRQRPISLTYKGVALDVGYRIDLVVDGNVLVELKTVDALLPIHMAQVITYLRLSGLPVGLLVNQCPGPQVRTQALVAACVLLHSFPPCVFFSARQPRPLIFAFLYC